MTSLTIVTVIHNSAADLARLTASLAHLPVHPELVVVDSGSSDGGAAAARSAGAQVLELDGSPGFGAACNAGVLAAGEAVTALVNPDAELLDDGLAALARAAATGPDALLAPRLLNADGSVQDSAHPLPGRLGPLLAAPVPRPLLPPPVRLRLEPWRAQRPTVVGWATGACLVARTALLRQLGPFDPAAFLFAEDMDLCLRASAAGVPTLLHPEVALRHVGGRSTGPALGGSDLALRARRRREVVAGLGRARLLLDDAEQAITFASRAAAKSAVGGGRRERAQLRALGAARRAGT